MPGMIGEFLERLAGVNSGTGRQAAPCLPRSL
jgi:hypothetical protein